MDWRCWHDARRSYPAAHRTASATGLRAVRVLCRYPWNALALPPRSSAPDPLGLREMPVEVSRDDDPSRIRVVVGPFPERGLDLHAVDGEAVTLADRAFMPRQVAEELLRDGGAVEFRSRHEREWCAHPAESGLPPPQHRPDRCTEDRAEYRSPIRGDGRPTGRLRARECVLEQWLHRPRREVEVRDALGD